MNSIRWIHRISGFGVGWYSLDMFIHPSIQTQIKFYICLIGFIYGWIDLFSTYRKNNAQK